MRQFFDFEADEKKPADEHKIVLQSEGFWYKHTCYFYSQTCMRQSLLGPLKSGRLGQVVVL